MKLIDDDFMTAHEQFIFIVEMQIESAASDIRPIYDFLKNRQLGSAS